MRISMFIDLLKPKGNIFEGVPVREIKNDDNTMRSST
jgi:hypothetical protein